MKKIVIFAGTTEGRRLSEILADAGIAHTVCVATEYGEIVMREQTDAEAAGTKGQPLVSLHRGRMDRQQMEEFLRNEGYEIVVDATHPYAQVVTENIRDAVKTQSSIYLRLEREISETPEAENPAVSIRYFESNADCAKALENTEGNILLTTGSKELSTYCASGRLHDRLYVRILPGRESLELCMEQNQRQTDPGIAGTFFHRDERRYPEAIRYPSHGHEKQRTHRRVSGETGSCENSGDPGVCDTACQEGCRYVFFCGNLWKTGTAL